MRARFGLAALAAVGGALLTAAPAAAVNCTTFKTGVENASDGAVITLDAGLTCTDTYNLPSGPPPFRITIQGGGPFGATLNGVGKSQSIMSGTASAGQLHVTIRNLTFRNGTAASGAGGGAISLSGGGDIAMSIDRGRFYNNDAPGGQGGAVHVSSSGAGTLSVSRSIFGDGTAAGANTADHGGALELAAAGTGAVVSVAGSSFRGNAATFTGGAVGAAAAAGTSSLTDNTFSGNSAGDQGGAVRLGGPALEVMRNTFQGNAVNSTLSIAGVGGALAAVAGGTGGTLTQRGNRFEANKVTRGAQSQFSSLGGAEYVGAYALGSRNDRFTGNSIPGPVGSGEAEGGALAIEGCGAGATVSQVENAAIAANLGGPKTHGVGIYAGGCSSGPVDLRVVNATIAANRASGAGATANLFGGADDTLTLRNSIVIRAFGGANMAGFGAGRTVRYSDVCAPNKLAGAGNICAPAVLRDPDHGDIRQTVGSPTINRGINAAIQGGPAHDFEGNKRILLGRVDMGADEYLDPFGGVGIPTQTDRIASKTRTVEVTVRCPAKVRGPCAGNLRLLRKGTLLGQGNFKVPRGTSKTVTVSLTHDAVSQVKSAGTLSTIARATSDDGFGTAAKSAGNVTLKS
jgi:hypothetical protein